MNTTTVIRALRGLGSALLDFVYPPHCSLCKAPLQEDERVVCEGCWSKIQVISGPHCATCGCPLDEPAPTCTNCESETLLFDRARILSPFDETIQSLIHLLKYKGKRSIGHRLGAMLGELIASDGDSDGADVIVPVPLHPSRKKERGYNQSALVASAIGDRLGVGTNTDLLVRTRRTATQTKLNAEERVKNVTGAFEVVHPEPVRGKGVLLVDDVLTTGATVNACAQALLEAGAKRVRLAALAHPFSEAG